jgi:hypothetical protein
MNFLSCGKTCILLRGKPASLHTPAHATILTSPHTPAHATTESSGDAPRRRAGPRP